MNTIFQRTSVRDFKDTAVEPAKIDRLLRAAMAAPSAANQQPWEFVVVTDRDMLQKLAQCSPYASCLAQAPLGFVLCMRTQGLRCPEYTQIDLSAATENLLLEAVELGLGAVWLGIAPIAERMETVRQVIGAPETIQPFALVACGYPAGSDQPADRYDVTRIHHDRW